MGFKIEQGEKFALLAFSGLTIGIDDPLDLAVLGRIDEWV
jgi:hypothetical protein